MGFLRRLIRPRPVGIGVSTGLLALRLVAGTAFMFHGWGKIQNPWAWMGAESTMPSVFQALAALSEFGGGLAWVLGLFVPFASAGILCTMAVATHLHMITRGDPFVGRDGSYELALVYLAVALLLLLSGPGLFSVDAALFGRRSRSRP